MSNDMLQAFEHREVLKSQDTECFGYLVHTDELTMMFEQEIAPAGCAFRTGNDTASNSKSMGSIANSGDDGRTASCQESRCGSPT